MSANDEQRSARSGFYGNSMNGSLPPLLTGMHHVAPSHGIAAQSHLMWPGPPHHATVLSQQFAQLQQQHPTQPHQPQQQQQPCTSLPRTTPTPNLPHTQYNDLLYNMHGATQFTAATHQVTAPAAVPMSAETYSVLPVGHGNFLKVYHSAEGAGTNINNTHEPLVYANQHPQQPAHMEPPFQQQQQQQQHPSQQQPFFVPPPAQTHFNSYELFSSSKPRPSAADRHHDIVTAHRQATEELVTLPASLHLLAKNSENVCDGANTDNASNTTAMIINELVNNWSPNLTGDTYAQFKVHETAVQADMHNRDPNGSQSSEQDKQQLLRDCQGAATPAAQPNYTATANDNANFPKRAQRGNAELHDQQQQHSEATQPGNSTEITPNSNIKETLGSRKSTATTGNNNSHLQPALEAVTKKRIVAEVKPMRMTYSDVLSKLNSQHDAAVQAQVQQTKTARSKQNAAAQIFAERKTDHKRGMSEAAETGNSLDEAAKPVRKSAALDKENIQQQNALNTATIKAQNRRRVVNNTPISTGTNGKSLPKSAQKSATGASETATAAANAGQKKRLNKRSSNVADSKTEATQTSRSAGKNNNSNAPVQEDKDGYYNVTAKRNDSYDRSNKSGNSAQSSSFRRQQSKATNNFSTISAGQMHSRNAQRSAHSSNGSVSPTFSYSSKRGRGGGASGCTLPGNQSSRIVELVKLCLHKWWECMQQVLIWLFYLVYDIVVLGCSIGYERMLQGYACSLTYMKQLRVELRQNSNKPSIWLKNYWRCFDARFKKNSIWAFWRRFYKKKAAEVATDFYKNGRLPQSGEEAMYSLLNCKGKDAYSILGVPPDCSQEQIRKHYKKIAVLVHPDKNKQAGAEEAFKVLQRAFELIGEPENRESYDKGLAEALHAEKAWTELHDLLSQLQTKITEAANTIRCSTCGLRHPRKLTDRPHYAARECASCKIRHSAREGDIWAETSFMGLRWKYLALMEGKVYDITDWANCQKGALSHLEPNSHMVQYRIVRGAQQQQQQQQAQYNQQQHTQQAHGNGNHNQHPFSHGQGTNSKYKRDVPPSEASLHEFLDNLYSGQNPNGQSGGSTAFSGSTRKRTRRN